MEMQIKENRLKLLKKSHLKIRQKKREGFDPRRQYSLGDVIFSKAHSRFGKVVAETDDQFVVDYGTEVITYHRNVTAPGLSKPPGGEKPSNGSGHAKKPVKHQEPLDSEADNRKRFVWTEEKDQFIREHLDQPNKWLADQLGTTVASVKGRTHRLKESGIIGQEDRRNFVWDAEKDQYLLENLTRSNKDLADELATSVGSVKGRIRRLRERGMLARGERR